MSADIDREMILERKEFIFIAISIFISLAVYIIAGLTFFYSYTPDIGRILQEIKTISTYPINWFLPEPAEKTLYILGLVIVPVIMTAVYWYLKDKQFKKSERSIKTAYFAIIVLSAAILSFMVLRSFIPRPHAYDYILIESSSFLFMTFNKFFAYTFIVVPILFISILYCKWFSPVLRKFGAILAYGSIGMIIALIFLMNTFSCNAVDREGAYTLHFDTVIYSVSQVFQGVPMLVNGFVNTYGLYPHMLNFIFKLTGLTVLSFTAVMSTLLAISYICIFLIMRKNIKNTIILYLGFTTVFYIGYLVFRFNLKEYYFQYHPIRYIFPCMTAVIALLYAEKRSAFRYYMMLFFAALAVFWNFDSGIVVYITTVAYVVYIEFGTRKWNRRNIMDGVKHVGSHIFRAGMVLAAVLGVYEVSIRLFYGQFPDITKYLTISYLFSNLGFCMIPMQRIHFWNFVILVYIIGLGISLRSVYEKNITNRSAMIFFLSVMGLGTFSYYQARSVITNLMSVSSPCLILVAFYADTLAGQVERYGLKQVHAVIFLIVTVYVMSFSFIDIYRCRGQISDFIAARSDIFLSKPKVQETINDIGFIKKYTKYGEKIFIFTENQGVYFIESGTVSAFQPALVEIFLKKDQMRLREAVKDSGSFKLFAEDGYLKECMVGDIVGKYYKCIAKSGRMSLYEK